MAYVSISNVKVRGITVCSPSRIVENRDYDVIPQDQRQSFIEAIGVERKHCVEDGVCTSDLCYKAGEHLLNKIRWKREDIGLIVFVSQTPDYKMPATSCLLQHRFGLPTTCMTIDVSQGCSGYLYGLAVAGSLLQSGTIKKCLLCVGNTQSRNCNYNDKSVYPLFSDLGSVTAIEYNTDESDKFQLAFGTDGSGEHTIIIPDGGYRNPVSAKSFDEKTYEGGIRRSNLNLFMQGDDVFSFVVKNIPKVTKDLFAHYREDASTIDYFLIHHASKFLCNKLIKKLSAPAEKVPLVLRDYGNASNATIPLLMCTAIREQVLKKALKYYMTGFGVGLSLGVGICEIGQLDCADLIEI